MTYTDPRNLTGGVTSQPGAASGQETRNDRPPWIWLALWTVAVLLAGAALIAITG